MYISYQYSWYSWYMFATDIALLEHMLLPSLSLKLFNFDFIISSGMIGKILFSRRDMWHFTDELLKYFMAFYRCWSVHYSFCSDTVACVDPKICMEVCENPAGCSNIAYPQLILDLAPIGEYILFSFLFFFSFCILNFNTKLQKFRIHHIPLKIIYS
jgi:hypothetical protein